MKSGSPVEARARGSLGAVALAEEVEGSAGLAEGVQEVEGRAGIGNIQIHMNKKVSIKKLEEEIKRLRRLAYKDELTELFNRRGFKEEANKFFHEIAGGRKRHRRKALNMSTISVIMIDADYFKKINDEHGHDAGDLALRRIAKIILERVREIDVVARWGGEEFIVALVGATENDAAAVADDIRENVQNDKLVYDCKSVPFTISAGVVSLSSATKTLDELVASADKALYLAKNTGRNKVVKFSDLGR